MQEVQRRQSQSVEIPHPEIAEIRSFINIDETADAARSVILDTVRNIPTAAISYATGETMWPVYLPLAIAAEYQKVDFSKSGVFHPDERYPLPPGFDSTSFAYQIDARVAMPLDVPRDHIFFWNGRAADPEEEAARYNALLAQHPIDLAVLGIGTDGHIAFNIPGTSFASECHYVPQLNKTILDRDRIVRGENVPPGALTQGISNILNAKKILLVAYGTDKGLALRKSLYGPISDTCPASALRLVAPEHKVHIYIDQMAAAAIQASAYNPLT